jgi:hypothetical protein
VKARRSASRLKGKLGPAKTLGHETSTHHRKAGEVTGTEGRRGAKRKPRTDPASLPYGLVLKIRTIRKKPICNKGKIEAMTGP